ncbi:LysR family transcriptional regulator [Dongshaea marina]|uniref:LysR family transcriptional regulator n=1 Tax=Dongshaea marina TaxID=2047966 RepID=UPI000D3EC302|nr:LysR family transcriptional regulator [Dongshaea marina]
MISFQSLLKTMLSKQLMAFLMVSQYKSITVAAEKINTVPSNISNHLAALESRLGLKLYYRTDYGVALTEDGEALEKHCLIQQQNIKEYFEQLTSKEDRIKLGITLSVIKLYLKDEFDVFEKYRVQIIDQDIRELIFKLETNEIDCIITHTPDDFNPPKKVDCRHIKSREIKVYYADKSILNQQTINIYTAYENGGLFNSLFKSHIKEFPEKDFNIIAVSNYDNITRFVEAGKGIMIYAQSEALDKKFSCMPIAGEHKALSVSIMKLVSNKNSNIDEFIDELVKLIERG